MTCDYLQEMPLAEGQFDVLIALYAGGIAHACKRYLKTGGILVNNNFHHDAENAALDPEYHLISVVRRRKKECAPIHRDTKSLANALKKAGATKTMRQTSQGLEYTQPDDHFIFRRGSVQGVAR